MSVIVCYPIFNFAYHKRMHIYDSEVEGCQICKNSIKLQFKKCVLYIYFPNTFLMFYQIHTWLVPSVCRFIKQQKHFWKLFMQLYTSSVQFRCSVMSDSLQLHGLQHARLPCPSPTPRACSNSCPSSQWWHWTISSSVIPFSSCLQTFPVSGSCPWDSSSHQVAKVLELQLQHQSFQWIFRTDFL